jgi:hypothetical protein
MALRRLLLIPAAVLTLTLVLSAQTAKPSPTPKPPQLKLEVVPAKKTYNVAEPVVVKYKFTNLSDKTVCFPTPHTSDRKTLEGYVSSSAMNSNSEEDLFIESTWPVDPRTDQDLLNEANEKWIKVAPGLSYLTEAAHPVGSLAAGDWKLKSEYVPPYLRGRATLIVDALGCTPPEVGATSEPVMVIIAPAAPNQ